MELNAEAEFSCSIQQLTDVFQNLEVVYPLYCPTEHIVCRYLKGTPLTPGSVLFFQEYIAGKKQTMKYRVQAINRQEKTTEAIFEAMFPRSLFGIRVVFRMLETEHGVLFSRSIIVGDFKNTLLSTLVEKLALILLGKKYYSEMVTHNQEDLQKLKEYCTSTIV